MKNFADAEQDASVGDCNSCLLSLVLVREAETNRVTLRHEKQWSLWSLSCTELLQWCSLWVVLWMGTFAAHPTPLWQTKDMHSSWHQKQTLQKHFSILMKSSRAYGYNCILLPSCMLYSYMPVCMFLPGPPPLYSLKGFRTCMPLLGVVKGEALRFLLEILLCIQAGLKAHQNWNL